MKEKKAHKHKKLARNLIVVFKKRRRMVFSRRSSSTIGNVVAVKPADFRLIDGSKSCARLLEEHLQQYWCATNMNLFTDPKGRINGFIHGDFLVEFEFCREDDKFAISTCVYHPSEHGAVDQLNEKIQAARDEITDSSITLSQTEEGAIFLAQRIQAASCMVDEDLEQTLEIFFIIARSVRKSSMPKRRKRNLSWFTRNKDVLSSHGNKAELSLQAAITETI